MSADYTKLLLLQKYGSPSQQANATTVLKALEQKTPEPVNISKGLLDSASQPLMHGTAYDSTQAILDDVTLKCSNLPNKTKAQIAALLIEQKILGS